MCALEHFLSWGNSRVFVLCLSMPLHWFSSVRRFWAVRSDSVRGITPDFVRAIRWLYSRREKSCGSLDGGFPKLSIGEALLTVRSEFSGSSLTMQAFQVKNSLIFHFTPYIFNFIQNSVDFIFDSVLKTDFVCHFRCFRLRQTYGLYASARFMDSR